MSDKTKKEDEQIIIDVQPLTKAPEVLLDNNITTLLAPKESTNYAMILQDPTINALSRVSTKGNIIHKEFTTTGIIKTKNGNTDLQTIIKDYSKVQIKQSTNKMLRVLQMCFASNKKKLIQIPLKEYMSMTGMKSEQKARVSILADLDALHNTECIAYSEINNKTECLKFDIVAERGIKNGVIFANLTDTIFAHLSSLDEKKAIMPYSLTLLKKPCSDRQNPYLQCIGDKVLEQKRYHIWDESFRISVKTLLNVCIDMGLPTYESIQKGSRHVNKLIIEPFERDLEAASIGIFDWEYCNEKGLPLTDEQISCETKNGKYKPQTYKEFEKLYINITFKADYPKTEFDVKKSKATKNKQEKTDKGKKGKSK